jgi:hypothetical protein
MAALEVDLYKKRLVDATMTGQNASTTKVIIYDILDIRLSDYKRHKYKFLKNTK